METTLPQKAYIRAHRKSYLLGIILTTILGPLGLFYCSPWLALVLCILICLTFATIIGPIVIWAFSILASLSGVSMHNRRVRATAGLH